MIKTATRTFWKSFFVLAISIMSSSAIHAQEENRLPTQEELDAKNAKLANLNWQTSIGKVNPTTGVLVTGVEQDCSNALPVCAQSYTQTTSYTGIGSVQEVNGTCLSGGETNSAWYVFTVQTTGNFGFTLNTTVDYDFALYDITTTGCSGIPTSTPVRCNFSGTTGNTGMSTAGTCASCSASQGPFSTELAVTAGSTYALIINNWSANATGYTLAFTSTAGHASITDVTAPTLTSMTNNCNNTVTLSFSEPIKCTSIAANGSDFTISGGGTITAASGTGCGTGLTSSVTLTYTAPSTGTYTIGIATGSDGNTLLDKCSNPMSTSQTLSFNHLGTIAVTPSPSTICTSGAAVTLTASGAPVSTSNVYSINPGSITLSSNGSGNATTTVNPTATTSYVASVTYGGCTKTGTGTVTLVSSVVVSISPVNPTICSGTTNLTATTLVNGVADPTATFQWAGGSTATTATIAAGAGTYSVTTVGSSGCPGGNTATSTVTLASSTASNCNVYYVSPSGGGTGLTKSSPTDLASALNLSICQTATIKMQVGVYTLTDKVDVNSYVTIEGGFDAAFTTKTSDMSGGANSTTIRRSNTADSNSSTSCTAFSVAASATAFRFQDLRIEMPGNAAGTVPVLAAGSGISNYGIKLGASCTSYNIVRCYIDAGIGAAP